MGDVQQVAGTTDGPKVRDALAALDFTTRCSIIDQFANRDPLGELTMAVPEASIDLYATVIAVDFAETPLA